MRIQVGIWFVLVLPGIVKAQAQLVSNSQPVGEPSQEKRVFSLSERKILPLLVNCGNLPTR